MTGEPEQAGGTPPSRPRMSQSCWRLPLMVGLLVGGATLAVLFSHVPGVAEATALVLLVLVAAVMVGVERRRPVLAQLEAPKGTDEWESSWSAQRRVASWMVHLFNLSARGSQIASAVAPYATVDGLRFIIERKNSRSWLARRLRQFSHPFGLRDLTTGFPELDRPLYVASNDEAKMRQILANGSLRQRLEGRPGLALRALPPVDESGREQKDAMRAGTIYYLSFSQSRLVTDPASRAAVFELMEETLEELCRVGSASRDTG